MGDLQEIQCIVTGRVQRVMYRDFVQRKARGMSLRGSVENKEDGSVVIVAQGSEMDLERLIEHLHKGPFAAKVLNVAVDWREPKKKLEGFRIKY